MLLIRARITHGESISQIYMKTGNPSVLVRFLRMKEVNRLKTPIMAESKLAGIEHVKKTLSIKKIPGKDLTVDVYCIDLDMLTPNPAILYFH
jgi:hypothetical protein